LVISSGSGEIDDSVFTGDDYRQQISEFVRVDSSQDHATADARVEPRIPVALAASSRVAAASTLQHSGLPRHTLLETVRADRRQGLGRARGTV